MPEVIVVGAGFAGLSAAVGLARGGLDVLVIEARDRVGGRVWSDELGAPDGSRYTIERGAEFVLDGYATLEGLVAEYGLTLAPTGMSYYVREPRGVPGASAEALGRAGRAVAGAVSDSGARTVSEAVACAGLAPPIAEAVLARVEISCALEADHLAPSALDHLASFEPLPSHRIAGGNARLARALADELGPDRIRFGTPIRALDRSDVPLRVRVDGGELEADHVLLALPLPVLRRLMIEPPLPTWKLGALARVEIGHAAKLHVPLAASAPASAVMSVPDRFWCWTATGREGRVAPILNCFAGSPSALRELAVTGGPGVWLERARNLRDDLELVTSGAVLTTWDDDPWALGAYRASGLAAVSEAELAAPVGAVHFAGEYAAGELSGLMEGALRSGQSAAVGILRELGVSGKRAPTMHPARLPGVATDH